jgi:branched-chain amino acid transport system substrate-binding protein
MQRFRPAAVLRGIAVAGLLAGSASGVAACGSSHSSRMAAAKSGPLSIGISLSLTGDFADPGRASLRGYQLWADTVNNAGGILGRQVQLVVMNDGSSAATAVSNYKRLIVRDKVNVVLGPFSSLLTAPSAKLASRYGYAFVEPAGGGPSVFAGKLHNLFFVQQAPVVKQGAVFADYILSLPAKQRPKTAAYPKLDDPFAAPIADYVRARFQAAGIRTVYNGTYSATTSNLMPTMTRLAKSRPDVVVSGTQSDDAYGQVNALVRLGFKPKWFYMSNGANSPTEFPDKVGGGHVDGIMSSDDWLANSTDLANANFVRAYIAKFGGSANNIDPTSAESFSAGMLLQDVARRTGKLDNATIIRSLHSGSWPTVVGNLRWNAIGEPQGSYTLVQWIDGQLTPVFPSSRAQHPPVGSTGVPRW